MEVYFPYQDLVYDQGDDGVEDVPEAPRGHFQSRVFQQSVTLTARMWPDDEGLATAAPPTAPGWRWGAWRIPADQLAVLVGAVCGGALLLVLLCAAIAWRCCILPRRHKSYCTRISEELAARHRAAIPVYHNQCAVYADPKKGHWAYNSRLVSAPHGLPLPNPGTHWFYNSRVLGVPGVPGGGVCAMSRSASYAVEVGQVRSPPRDRKRPLSQPIRFASCDLAVAHDRRHPRNPMPEISEFSAQRTQFASSSISFILTVLDDVDRCRALDDTVDPDGTALKTRSLPAWVRSRPRPLSTENNVHDLYAKVNFSKKRKNRMRNDEAAIIALSKSRSQFLHKDTDSLVDNEAVIVYNERTAL